MCVCVRKFMDSKNILTTYHFFTTYHIFAPKIRRPIFLNFSGRGQPLFSNFHSMGPPIIKKDAAVPGGDANISGTALSELLQFRNSILFI